MAAFENRQPATEAKLINKSSLFIILLGFIRQLELKLVSEQIAEKIFVAQPYCQTACCVPFYLTNPPILVRYLSVFYSFYGQHTLLSVLHRIDGNGFEEIS